MAPEMSGIHHVTAVASDPQANVDLYAGVLGLRLVKRTVNFDDPGTYHLYYGDGIGRPGTLLTFFPAPGTPRGRRGTGTVDTTSFSVPEGSLDWWASRLDDHGIDVKGPDKRLGELAIGFQDADGMGLELVARSTSDDERPGWDGGPVPHEHAVRGLDRVELMHQDDVSDAFLTEALDWRPGTSEGRTRRFELGDGGPGAIVDVRRVRNRRPAVVAAGVVHHVAFRTPDERTQSTWRQRLGDDQRTRVTPVMDRVYFRSIYFREPGGVLFEVATDGPGFLVDEDETGLGSELRLPPWLEGRRDDIHARLAPLRASMV